MLKMEIHPLLTILVFVLIAWVGFKYFEHINIYFPEREIVCTPAAYGLPYEELTLTTKDKKRINAWFIPSSPGTAPGANTSPKGARHGGAAALDAAVVVFCHGNAGNISHRLDKIRIFNSLGLGVLIFDYRGYGKSTGRPCEKGIYLDAEAAYQYLASARAKAGTSGVLDVLFYGESLGCAVAVELALRHKPSGLILESPFTSIPDMGAKFFPWLPVRFMVTNKYDSLAKIGGINCPLLVLHSPDDEIVPFEMGRRLFEAAPGPKELVEMSGSHNDGFLFTGKEYIEGIKSFVDKWSASGGTGRNRE